MKCSVFIATSADGYIATVDGGVDWLHNAANNSADDMGFQEYLASVDCMIIGRKCMETIAKMELSAEQWPYGEMPIYVLSRSLKQAPANLPSSVKIYSGELAPLIAQLEQQGYNSAYIDGGVTITSFLNHGLIDEMTITTAPVLLGEGLPLFGKLKHQLQLSNTSTKCFANNFHQVKYQVNYR